jgi:hypothetical protein
VFEGLIGPDLPRVGQVVQLQTHTLNP